MSKKQKDRHLDVPAEANRDKHINFVAEEKNEMDPAQEAATGALADEATSRSDQKKDKKVGKKN
jgi:hypothetical protein